MRLKAEFSITEIYFCTQHKRCFVLLKICWRTSVLQKEPVPFFFFFKIKKGSRLTHRTLSAEWTTQTFHWASGLELGLLQRVHVRLRGLWGAGGAVRTGLKNKKRGQGCERRERKCNLKVETKDREWKSDGGGCQLFKTPFTTLSLLVRLKPTD